MEKISQKEARSIGLSKYFTGKKCKHGHLSERLVSDGHCCQCKYEKNKKSYNQEKIRKNNKLWYERNRDYKISKNKEYNRLNKEKHSLYVSKYRRKNPMIVFIRSTLERIERQISPDKYENILGYTQEDFILHIESLWLEGMSWDNRGEWHIDHIKSIKKFKDEGVTDPKIINALSNLQPLWAIDNLRKGA